MDTSQAATNCLVLIISVIVLLKGIYSAIDGGIIGIILLFIILRIPLFNNEAIIGLHI